MFYDVVVVGGGIAGLMSAIEAKRDGNKVAVITKGNIFRSNSALASGGINAVLDATNKDEVNKHIEDTLNGAYGLGDKKAITYMCQKASSIIDKLIDYGVEFDRDESGNIAQRSFGGGSSKRTCYVGDKTGASIMQTLIKKAKSVGITYIVNSFVTNLTTTNNQVTGVVTLRKSDSSIIVYPAKSVILASGGYAGIYRGHSTNGQDVVGDSLAIALRAGLSLRDMEFVQFHPTGFVKTNYLVSEAARGEGGYLVNSEGYRFVDELETRDVVSQAIYNEILANRDVYIDLRHLPKSKIENRLPNLYKSALAQANIDISKELLPIKPVAHYSMGGIDSDMTKTKIKGLFVSGEAAAIGVHGANRLGGNSLLEGAVFGELAGCNAFEYSIDRDFLPIDYETVAKDQKMCDNIFDGTTTRNFNVMRVSLGKTMFESVGIIRDYKSLHKAYKYIEYLRHESITLHTYDKSRVNNVELIAILELRNALEVAESIILSALKREESRGSHKRYDFNNLDKSLNKSILTKYQEKGYFKLFYKDNRLLSKLRDFIINN